MKHMTKEDIHINFLQQVIELHGYTKEEVEGMTIDNIELSETGYIYVTYNDIRFDLLLKEYLEYRDWWISLERQRKIKFTFPKNKCKYILLYDKIGDIVLYPQIFSGDIII